MRARFPVEGCFDTVNKPQKATVFIDREKKLFEVRILRRHTAKTVPLSTVAEMVYKSAVAAEVKAEMAKKPRRRLVSRGLLTTGR